MFGKINKMFPVTLYLPEIITSSSFSYDLTSKKFIPAITNKKTSYWPPLKKLKFTFLDISAESICLPKYPEFTSFLRRKTMLSFTFQETGIHSQKKLNCSSYTMMFKGFIYFNTFYSNISDIIVSGNHFINLTTNTGL